MGFIMRTARNSFPFPDSIIIKGTKYKVVKVKNLKDDDGNECQGLHDHVLKVISIDSALRGANRRKTFLHELAHAYLYECHIREGLDGQLEEVIIEIIVNAFDKHFDIRWRNLK